MMPKSHLCCTRARYQTNETVTSIRLTRHHPPYEIRKYGLLRVKTRLAILYTYRSSRSFPLQMDRGAAGVTQRGPGESSSQIKLGWCNKCARYSCRVGKRIEILRRTADVRDLDETKIVPRNRIAYAVGEDDVSATVSGVEFDRDMKIVFGGPTNIRTMIFPAMVKVIR